MKYSSLAIYVTSISVAPAFALHVQTVENRKWTPLDTSAQDTFEGPDMIMLYPAGHVPGRIPVDEDAPRAKEKQIRLDRDQCKLYYPHGNVYLVKEPALKPYLLSNKQNRNTSKTVIISPGGGNSFLAWEREGTNVAEWLNTIGINAYVLLYRVPDESRNNVMDAQRAVSFVRHHSNEFGIDPTQIGFMGFSAGGYMASALSLAKDRHYARVDKADEVDFHPDFSMLIYGSGPAAISETAHHRPPPTFSVSAADDTCVPAPAATDYCNAVSHARRDEPDERYRCKRLVYKNGGHGYGTCQLFTNKWSGDAVCDWTNQAQAWLNDLPSSTHRE